MGRNLSKIERKKRRERRPKRFHRGERDAAIFQALKGNETGGVVPAEYLRNLQEMGISKAEMYRWLYGGNYKINYKLPQPNLDLLDLVRTV